MYISISVLNDSRWCVCSALHPRWLRLLKVLSVYFSLNNEEHRVTNPRVMVTYLSTFSVQVRIPETYV